MGRQGFAGADRRNARRSRSGAAVAPSIPAPGLRARDTDGGVSDKLLSSREAERGMSDEAGQSGGVKSKGRNGKIEGDIVGRDKIITITTSPSRAVLDAELKPLADALAAAPATKRVAAEQKLAALPVRRKEPENSNFGWSRDGEQRKATADSTSDRRELGRRSRRGKNLGADLWAVMRRPQAR
jgi:hypothetical protein